MPWNAKPSGPYGLRSAEANENLFEMNAIFTNWGYTLEAECGMFGNVFAESGLNPWRWQSDTVNLSAGYGLFQFTPARSYLDNATGITGYSPNLSVTQVSPGATPEDGVAQCFVIDGDVLNKWVSSCWRGYWNKSTYADQWALSQEITSTYGSGSALSLSQFKNIPDLYSATFAFLACYEGPAVPNFETRYQYARDIYQLLTGIEPPDPPEKRKKKMPLWYYLKKM